MQWDPRSDVGLLGHGQLKLQDASLYSQCWRCIHVSALENRDGWWYCRGFWRLNGTGEVGRIASDHNHNKVALRFSGSLHVLNNMLKYGLVLLLFISAKIGNVSLNPHDQLWGVLCLGHGQLNCRTHALNSSEMHANFRTWGGWWFPFVVVLSMIPSDLRNLSVLRLLAASG